MRDTKFVSAIVVLGQDVDETGRLAGPNSQKRIQAGLHALYRARRDGDAVLVFTPGKHPQGWKSPDTFATIMANYARTLDSDVEIIVNDFDDDVWTSWPEIDLAVDMVKNWYRKNHADQMTASWNDYSALRIVFVSDPGHLPRICLMAGVKLQHHKFPPTDERFGDGLKSLVWCTEPSWSTT